MHSNRVVIGWVQSRCNSVGWCNAEEVVARAFGSHTPTHTARDAVAASCARTRPHMCMLVCAIGCAAAREEVSVHDTFSLKAQLTPGPRYTH